MIELLNARLADCIDLQTQIKQAHWNVKGPNFIALHELFDKINEDVEDYVDEIAERRCSSAALPRGRPGWSRSTARLPNTRARGGRPQPRRGAVLGPGGLRQVGRQAIDDANELGDLDTADLFTEVSRGIDKWLWFVEAHLQADR